MLSLSQRTTILELAGQGVSKREIARVLGVSRLSVRRVLRASSAEVPELDRAEKAEPYRQQILERMHQCKGNLVRVHEELVAGGAKGRKDRLGYASNGSADALKDWLVVRGYDPGPLFCNIKKSGRITIHRLTDQAVLHVLKKRAVQASVASFSPHDLRRSFISDLLDAGADISTAQQLAC